MKRADPFGDQALFHEPRQPSVLATKSGVGCVDTAPCLVRIAQKVRMRRATAFGGDVVCHHFHHHRVKAPLRGAAGAP
jgi:hypothetical protein